MYINNINKALIGVTIDLINELYNYVGNLFVIKCGNNHIKEKSTISNIASNIALLQRLGINVIVVHGGGPQIGDLIKKLNLNDEFIDEHRVTNQDTFDVIEMILCGSIGVSISSEIAAHNGSAITISGRDCNMIIADKVRKVKKDEGSNIERIIDLGMIGDPISMKCSILSKIITAGIIPVLAPIGISKIHHKPYVINADTLAGFVASQMKADKLIILSDVDGIYDQTDTFKTFMTATELYGLLDNNIVPVDMCQKAITAIKAVNNGVKTCHILNGNIENILINEIVSSVGVGTKIKLRT